MTVQNDSCSDVESGRSYVLTLSIILISEFLFFSACLLVLPRVLPNQDILLPVFVLALLLVLPVLTLLFEALFSPLLLRQMFSNFEARPNLKKGLNHSQVVIPAKFSTTKWRLGLFATMAWLSFFGWVWLDSLFSNLDLYRIHNVGGSFVLHDIGFLISVGITGMVVLILLFLVRKWRLQTSGEEIILTQDAVLFSKSSLSFFSQIPFLGKSPWLRIPYQQIEEFLIFPSYFVDITKAPAIYQIKLKNWRTHISVLRKPFAQNENRFLSEIQNRMDCPIIVVS